MPEQRMNTNPVFDFNGLDHVALTCSDMKRTVDFYHGKLGMPVLHTIEYFDDAGGLLAQHWFFGVGDSNNPDAHIAFFWWKDGYQTLSKEDISTGKKPANRFARPVGSILHLNLRVSPDNMRPYAEKLTKMEMPFRHVTRYHANRNEKQATGLVTEGMRGITSSNTYHEPQEGWLMNSIYVFDPDGIEVEFNSWAPSWRRWRNDHVPKTNTAHTTG
jgi:catechol 2,3-dioxygenase-like lactoylglutathione lyase family enzyme